MDNTGSEKTATANTEATSSTSLPTSNKDADASSVVDLIPKFKQALSTLEQREKATYTAEQSAFLTAMVSNNITVQDLNNYEALGKDCTKFSGTGIEWSAKGWIAQNKLEIKAYAPTGNDLILLKVILHKLLVGKAKKMMSYTRFETVAELYEKLERDFPQIGYDEQIRMAVDSGSLLDDTIPETCASMARMYYSNMDTADHSAALIARALFDVEPMVFMQMLLHPCEVKAANMKEVFQKFDKVYRIMNWNSRGAYSSGNGHPNTSKSSPSRRGKGKRDDSTNDSNC
ncbi:hypothetical protein H4R20_004929 [Coemansia guatemalensis]|uniref:Uncharacterized protein n=1 Tax=Coemansia guatemalensis TaxID=2761395 RepID=A0A9W8HV96_9FUNG|nr:hypothetical protein H4R20_004929 [Coemansia guatemalensis]